MTTGGEYSSSATYKKLTIVKHNGSQWISKTDVPSGNAPSADSTYWQLMHGTTDLKVLMTGNTASLDPNKVYVWEEAVTNLTITALNGGKEGRRNRYVFQFKNPKSAYTVLTLPSGVLWSSDTELDDNGVPVLDRNGCTRVEIVDNLATAKRWPSIYIIFEDAEVEAVLMSKGVSSDGIGITRKDAREVSTIGMWFKNNTAITTFNELPLFGVTSLVDTAFRTSSLQSIDCKNVTTIGSESFYGCAQLAIVGDLSKVTSLGQIAFRGCNNLKQAIKMPLIASLEIYTFYNSGIISFEAPSVTTIAYNVFHGCTGLTSVKLGEITSIGSEAFRGCSALTSISDLSKLTTLGHTCFQDCSSLAQDVIIPNVATIERYTFLRSAITRIIAKGVKTIAFDAFKTCSSLQFVLLGSWIESIGSGAFASCGAISAFVCQATTPPTLGAANALINSTNWPIYVPDESVEAYKTTTNWNNTSIVSRIKGISDLQTDNPTLYAEIQDYL